MKIGLVLSGGGARGIVHLGVIKALEEYHIRFDRISATSAGAIIGALYSYGYGPEEILRIILKTSFFKSLRPAWRKTGLLSLERLREVMITYLPQNDFNALKIPVTIAATDLRQGKTDYFTSGELLPAILASACVPAMFDPVRIGAGLYVDGGILDNLPVKPIYDDSDFIVASYCNYVNPDFQVRNIRSVVERSLLMAVGANTILSRNMCDVLIEPPDAGRYSAFELNRAEDLFGIGYTFTKANFTEKDFPPHAKPSI